MRAPTAALDSLQGLALGDSFGDRWFSPRVDEAAAEQAARIARPGPWKWTDDTAMALVVVQHLDRCGEVRQETLGGWGDMDTTCAVAGGVTAARTGLTDVPAAWLDAREPLPAWASPQP
ncbi:ADP-ribosylglycohydrolase family protein [Kitasatospora sp. NPDC093679]|uniref:ADP-ribosylglycohydrolase family protein n=1 Tax=Kitasatospora sp. NPDC093679 TaxID=3154983 RepID=UPI00341A59B5